MSQNKTPNSLDDLMKELQIEYIASIPEKISAIHTHFEQKDWPTLRDDFHKLKGTGKTYGIPEITDLSAVLEKLCLENSPRLTQAVPVAIKLLQLIYDSRKNNKSYPVAQLPEFKALQ